MACASSCRTKDHATYGACLRAKNLRTFALPIEALATQKAADKNLDDYAKARSYGIQPSSTRPGDVQAAVRISEQTGNAFQG